MRLRTLTIFALLAGVTPAAAGVTPPGTLPLTSWGKGGVSLEQYWLDSAQCAATASGLDVSATPGARALVAASSELNQVANSAWMHMPTFITFPVGLGMNGGIRYQQTYNKFRPWEQIASVRQAMTSSLERCLTDRGYRQFKLTADQARQLRHLRRGTLARRIYLHSLGSDAELIARQQV